MRESNNKNTKNRNTNSKNDNNSSRAPYLLGYVKIVMIIEAPPLLLTHAPALQ